MVETNEIDSHLGQIYGNLEALKNAIEFGFGKEINELLEERRQEIIEQEKEKEEQEEDEDEDLKEQEKKDLEKLEKKEKNGKSTRARKIRE